jgi:signal peptidase I
LSGPEALLPQLVESCLEAGAEAQFEAQGRSMLPLIRPGDLLRVRRSDDQSPKLGDVVAVRGMPAGGLLLHRVVRLREGVLLLRGDNTTMDNGEYAIADVLAIVSEVERKGRLVWFGAGRWRRPVAWLVRRGWINRLNRAALFARRSVGRAPSGGPGRA